MKRSARPTALLVFLGAALLALGFAAYTQHVWEDYYITYRSSRHLATGEGLVFTPGERLHTFTSPLGVLLPALSFRLTGNTSDPAALWIFRAACAAALGGGLLLLLALARRAAFPALAAGFVVLALATDAKVLDFTINGMETAFMLLFLAYALWAHLSPGPRQWVHLGSAWAGLMWTRPDSFIYVAVVAAGFWLFNDPAVSGHTRRSLVGLCLRAGLLTTALYLPWLAWATWYYGSPIPHTIAAKGSLTAGQHDLPGLLLTAVQLPWLAWRESATLELTWLPSYFMIGGWPAWLATWSRVLGTVCALAWLVPGVPRVARAASFAFFGAHLYLTYFPYFPFPWYVPPTTLLGTVVLGGLLAHALTLASSGPAARLGRVAAVSAAACLLGIGGWCTWQVARQVEVQQRVVEDGTRRAIGEWLRQHARPDDAVFMEPLGYIGYFSGLKTFDYPGMSSSEMVAARRQVGEDWALLIEHLEPRWLVLRPFEAARVNARAPRLLTQDYALVREFNRTDEVQAANVRGQAYLAHDAHFGVYRLRRMARIDRAAIEIATPFPSSTKYIEGQALLEVHAPGTMTLRIPPDARGLRGVFAFTPGAEEGAHATDGAIFRIELHQAGHAHLLFATALHPQREPAHRGLHHYDVDLPADRAETAQLVFRTEPAGHNMQDWTCWSIPEFR